MRTRRFLLSLVSIIILFCGDVEAFKTKVISPKNEFGGRTVEKVVTPEDAKDITDIQGHPIKDAESDVTKFIDYYDSSDEVVKSEVFFADKFADESKIKRTIYFLDNNLKKMTKEENFYTDKYADESGVSQGVVYFDSNGKKTKAEYSHTGKYTDTYGIVKSIRYYDSQGRTARNGGVRLPFFVRIGFGSTCVGLGIHPSV